MNHRLNRYCIFFLLIATMLIRYIPSVYYTGGIYDHLGNVMVHVGNQMIPYKWKVFLSCELWAWFMEAVLVWFAFLHCNYRTMMRAVFFIWAIARAFDLVQFYSHWETNQFTVLVKILFNITILIIAIIRFDTDD